MKLLFSQVIALIISVSAMGQSSISGKVYNEKQKPAEFATVLLLKKADSMVVKSALTDGQGLYSFSNIGKGEYWVAATMVGYKKQRVAVSLIDDAASAPDIKLIPGAETLKEVNITVRKPFLEQRPDKLIVNVDGSATAAGSTALEVLQKVPGLIISDDKITMVGKGSPNILIDGRQSQYTDISQVLKDLSAANIDRIEVISNPGAKYDAAGGAAINIILKRNANLGTNGSISLSSGMGLYEQGNYGIDRNFYRLSPSVSLNHREGKLNTFGTYSFFHRNFYDYSEFNRLISGSRYEQVNYSPNNSDSHNFSTGMDLYLDKKNTFGIILRGFVREGTRDARNVTEQVNNGSSVLESTFQTLNNTTSKRQNFSGNFNWKHSFDTLGRDLNFDFDYSDFSIKTTNNITNIDNSNMEFDNQQFVDNPVKFGVLKLDYSHPITKNAKFEAGGKSSIANIDNFLTFIRNGVTDTDRSTNFKYRENINALYTSYQQKFGKWDFQGGLRAEQTVAKGEEELNTVLKRDYWQLFPSAFLTREITPKVSAVLQYTRRVNRPGFQQQNPFIEFLDSLTYTQGNPRLRPETADQYKISVTYENQPFIGFSYNKKHDVIFNNAPRQNGNLTYTTSENLGTYDNFAAELNFPLKLGKKISGFGGNQFIYNRYTAEYLNDSYKRSKWNWLAYWQLAYKPTTTLNFEVSGYYMTKFLNEFITIDNLGSLNLAIQKTFWDKKGRLSLNFNDILFSDNTKASILYREINVDFRQFYESRNARLTFSYSFGNQQLKAARNRKTASEDETNRVKAN